MYRGQSQSRDKRASFHQRRHFPYDFPVVSFNVHDEQICSLIGPVNQVSIPPANKVEEFLMNPNAASS
jgi:hypothetical protein